MRLPVRGREVAWLRVEVLCASFHSKAQGFCKAVGGGLGHLTSYGAYPAAKIQSEAITPFIMGPDIPLCRPKRHPLELQGILELIDFAATAV